MSTASALSRTPPPETSPSSAGEPGVAQVVVDSPIGPLLLVASEGALTHVWFDGLRHASADEADLPREDAEVLGAATVQLAEYFAGGRRAFDLPLRARGTTFQKAVWGELVKIPWGTTTTYGTIARALGLPLSASRAVGAANGANPISIIVPCHRVIGADGTLTGFGGGLPRKSALLRLEGVATERDQLVLFE
ncbi:MAG TPA: methylated-DNA--[protein]-cysteine S-methyltransferase [Lapillicoccus sp.]|jgi:methylated-DNA-[protein]-cysteine S-methyltransferase|nr:methylated-DNA--[protein]-cysteine S-methyltransferase [Lapillicoccus sp.]